VPFCEKKPLLITIDAALVSAAGDRLHAAIMSTDQPE
jgi:hypothetical protein